MTSFGNSESGRLLQPIEDTSLTVGEHSRDEPPQLGIEVQLAELLILRHQLKRAHDEVGDLFQIQFQKGPRCSLTTGTPRRTAQVDGFKMRWTQVGDLRSFTKAARRC